MTTDIKKPEFVTPGERLKYIRGILRLSRSFLQDKYGLPEITLKSWENGITKLTKTGAERCVEMYRNEGLILSVDWLMEGTGIDPKTTISVSNYFATPTRKDLPTEDDEVAMLRDANIFKESNTYAVVMTVSNDDMRPFYRAGDYIGGKMRFQKNEIENAVNKDCIIHLSNGDRYFRRFIRNSTGGYNLTCLNPNEVTSEPVLYNVEIKGVAPVIWHRWKDE